MKEWKGGGGNESQGAVLQKRWGECWGVIHRGLTRPYHTMLGLVQLCEFTIISSRTCSITSSRIILVRFTHALHQPKTWV